MFHTITRTRKALARIRKIPPCRVALVYHHVVDSNTVGDDVYSVTARNFRAQIRQLEKVFDLVPPDTLLSGEWPKRHQATVTFDDGWVDNYHVAFPILKALNAPAIFYVCSEKAGTGIFADWNQLREMTGAGMCIGSHGATHADFGILNEEKTRHELAGSRDRIMKETGVRVTSFAYPYGAPGNMKESDRRILTELGYTTAFVMGGGPFCHISDPYRVPRYLVPDILAPTMLEQLGDLMRHEALQDRSCSQAAYAPG